MTRVRIPGTSRVVFVSNHSGDYVFDMRDAPEATNAIKNEDLVIVGDWQDFQSSGTRSPQEVINAGLGNSEQGNLVANIHIDDKTNRGANSSTHRQRRKLVYFNLDEDN